MDVREGKIYGWVGIMKRTSAPLSAQSSVNKPRMVPQKGRRLHGLAALALEVYTLHQNAKERESGLATALLPTVAARTTKGNWREKLFKMGELAWSRLEHGPIRNYFLCCAFFI